MVPHGISRDAAEAQAPFVYNLRFPGQVYDSETGLHYNNARFYAPATGRYTQSDPIGLNGGYNRFAYVGGNPVNAVDPWGLQAAALPVLGSVCIRMPLICAATIATIIYEMNYQKFDSPSTASPPPSGNCTPDQQQRYQENVENQCGAAKSCYGFDAIDDLTRKISQQSKCIDARKLINDVCYDGGDARHKDAIDQRVNAISRCQRFLSQPHLR